MENVKYMLCNIQFENENIETVYIKCTNEVEAEEHNEVKIFFYGMNYDLALKNVKSGELIENEWKLIEILEVMEELD